MATKPDGRRVDAATQAHVRRAVVLAVLADMTHRSGSEVRRESTRGQQKSRARQALRPACASHTERRAVPIRRSVDAIAGPAHAAIYARQHAGSVKARLLSVDTRCDAGVQN